MLLDTLSTIGTVLDTPGSMMRALMVGEDPTEGIFDSRRRISGQEVLQRYGWKDAPWLAGLGLELVADPLNLLSGAGIAKALKGQKVLHGVTPIRRSGMPSDVMRATKAVDEFGKPITVKHGTPHAFEEFDFSKLDEGALYGPGAYFTDSDIIASEYAKKRAGRQITNEDILDYYKPGKVLPSKYVNVPPDEVLSVRTYPDGTFKDVTVRAVAPEGTPDYLRPKPRTHWTLPREEDVFSSNPNVKMAWLDLRSPADLRPGGWPGDETFLNAQLLGSPHLAKERLARQGYDSIIHEGGNRIGGFGEHNVYIAMDPSQIYNPWPVIGRTNTTEELIRNPRLAALLGAGAAAYNTPKFMPVPSQITQDDLELARQAFLSR